MCTRRGHNGAVISASGSAVIVAYRLDAAGAMPCESGLQVMHVAWRG